MKRLALFSLLVILSLTLAGCAPGMNLAENTAREDGAVAGFWQGLWHGFIALFTFIISLFNENVSIYEAHNNGGWYDFGFILGISAFFGGGGRGSHRAGSRKNS